MEPGSCFCGITFEWHSFRVERVSDYADGDGNVNLRFKTDALCTTDNISAAVAAASDEDVGGLLCSLHVVTTAINGLKNSGSSWP